MSRNPDLVPTVIVDVNGRTTIVHKLRKLFGGSSGASASRFPAPVASPESRLLSEDAPLPVVVKSLMKMLPLPEDKSDVKILKNFLSNNFPVESLRWFAEVISRDGSLADGVRDHLVSAQFNVDFAGRIDGEKLEREIRKNAFFYPLLGIDDYAEVKSLVWSLNMTSKFRNVDDFSTLSEDKRDRCVATMVAAHELERNYPAVGQHPTHPVYTPSLLHGGTGKLLKEPLYSFVFDNPDEVAQIVDAVIEHKTMDPSVLRGLMTGIAAPLAEGTL